MTRARTLARFRLGGNERRVEPVQRVAAILYHCFHLNHLNSGNSLTLQCSKQLTLRYGIRFRCELPFDFKRRRVLGTALQLGYVRVGAVL